MPLYTFEDFVARTKHPGTRPTIQRMLETTPAKVAGPNAASTVDELIPDEDLDWVPLDLPRAVRSRRTYRIPVILIAVVVAAGAYFAAQFALRLTLAHADEQREAYAEVLQTAIDAIPGLQAAASAVTDHAAGDSFGSHLPTLVRLEGLSLDIQAAADHSAPPLISRLPTQDLELLEPIRDRMDAIADLMTTIGGVLTDVATYRRALDEMFLLPGLPGTSDGPSVEVFSDRLSQMTAATVEAAALLPDEEMFSEHRSQVEALIEWLPGWQTAYLDALRDDDIEQADGLRDEATVRIEQVRSGLIGPLEVAATWATGTISQLTLDIQTALILTR